MRASKADGILDVDARGIVFYSFFAPPKKLGAGQFYLAAYLDGAGQRLRGSFGPKAPNGMEANWVPTVDNKLATARRI